VELAQKYGRRATVWERLYLLPFSRFLQCQMPQTVPATPGHPATAASPLLKTPCARCGLPSIGSTIPWRICYQKTARMLYSVRAAARLVDAVFDAPLSAGVEDVRRKLNAAEQCEANRRADAYRACPSSFVACVACVPCALVCPVLLSSDSCLWIAPAAAATQASAIPSALLHFIDSGGSPEQFTLDEIARAQTLLDLRPFQPLQKFSDNLRDELLKQSVGVRCAPPSLSVFM
jgi:hypothetical protein